MQGPGLSIQRLVDCSTKIATSVWVPSSRLLHERHKKWIHHHISSTNAEKCRSHRLRFDRNLSYSCYYSTRNILHGCLVDVAVISADSVYSQLMNTLTVWPMRRNLFCFDLFRFIPMVSRRNDKAPVHLTTETSKCTRRLFVHFILP